MLSIIARLAIPALALIAGLAPLSASAQQAQPDQQKVFWQTRCSGPSRAADTLVCDASQGVRVKESGQLLFKVDIIAPGNKAQPLLQMQAPLGFYLPGKIKLGVDGTVLTELSIGTCDQRGCFLSAPATQDMIDAMKAGNKLEIDFAATAQKRQKIELPLTGFTKAINSIL